MKEGRGRILLTLRLNVTSALETKDLRTTDNASNGTEDPEEPATSIKGIRGKCKPETPKERPITKNRK